MSLLPWQKGIVRRIEQQTANTRRFFVEAAEQAVFDFKPGQFVTLDLPIHEKPNKRWRSYSIASWPDGSNVFELCIVKMDGGAGSTYLFEQVSEGSELTFRGASGVFTLPPKPDRDLYLICTGTGIAPFRSMVHYIFENQVLHQKIRLIFGCRRMDDVLYGDEMRSLAHQYPGFEFHICLSREEETSGDPFIHQGYVHKVYKDLLSVDAQPGDAGKQAPLFMLCGWKNMVDEAKENLQAMGYTKSDILLELYG